MLHNVTFRHCNTIKTVQFIDEMNDVQMMTWSMVSGPPPPDMSRDVCLAKQNTVSIVPRVTVVKGDSILSHVWDLMSNTIAGLPSKHGMFIQCCINVGLASAMLAQH